MLHRGTSPKPVDVSSTRVIFTAGVLAAAALVAVIRPSAAGEPGRRCFGSETAVNDNLPLGRTSVATEVSEVAGLFRRASGRMVGWVYTTRNGNQFVQVGSPTDLAQLFRLVNEPEFAATVSESKAGTYFRMPSGVARSLDQHRSGPVLLRTCFGTGN
jgi:hypothetical protein